MTVATSHIGKKTLLRKGWGLWSEWEAAIEDMGLNRLITFLRCFHDSEEAARTFP
jgi:hypothetical protein